MNSENILTQADLGISINSTEPNQSDIKQESIFTGYDRTTEDDTTENDTTENPAPEAGSSITTAITEQEEITANDSRPFVGNTEVFFNPRVNLLGSKSPEPHYQLIDLSAEELDFKGLGKANLNFLVNAMDLQTDTPEGHLTTYNIAKTHVCKVLLLVIYFGMSKWEMVHEYVHEIFDIWMVLNNLFTVNLLFNYEFFSGCLINLVKLKLRYYSALDSIKLLVELLPTKKSIPLSLTLVIDLHHSQEAENHDKIFHKTLQLLQQISELIIWSCMIKLHHVNIYEPTGIYWYNSTNLYVLKQLIIQSFRCHLNTDHAILLRLPIIKLVELNTGTIITIDSDEIIEGNNKDHDNNGDNNDTDWNDTDWNDIDTNSTRSECLENTLMVYLISSNHDHSTNHNLAPSTDLILVPHNSLVNLRGYYSQNENKSPIIYHNHCIFGLSYFLTSLHYFKYHQEHQLEFNHDLQEPAI